MNINFEIAEKIDNNSELKKATENIIAGVNASVQGYLVIGTNLDQINVKKLWAQAGFASFSEYSEKVLGISKATAYRIISVSKKFLLPEITKAIPDRIFSPFQDTALAALNPIGDYDTLQNMEGIRVIGHVTRAEYGMQLVARDGNEFELLSQGWNPLKD